MLQRQRLLFATLCLCIVSTRTVTAISNSVTTEGPPPKDTAIPASSSQEENENGNEIESNRNNLFYSDELTSSEYEDDMDAEFDESRKREQNSEWDILIFTQQWPVTSCYHWREEDKKHECKLPDQKEFWTIHGIWPTKLGHIGPNFCNKSADFDVTQLQQIMDRLEQYWPDIHVEDTVYNGLWKHEWLKHGTCAMLLEELDNELKYFGQALSWRNSFLISNILGASGIHPDSNNTVISLQTAIVKALGKNPGIYCLYDDKADVSYLFEIRICFDKSLQLMDCDGVKRGDAISIDYPGGTVITNCHISKPVHYPSIVPPVQRESTESWKFPVVNMYKLLQFIMWFTL